MALPIILGVAAFIAAGGGIGAGVKGVIDTKKANETMDAARRRNEKNLAEFCEAEKMAKGKMEKLGELEMTTAKDFRRFSEAFEKIKNRPQFSDLKLNADIPPFDFNEIRIVSVAAGAFIGAAAGGVTGAVFGTAAAAGTTAAVMALGTASTGTAIASLSGAAATKAALAAIGGGSLAAGGGGIALGTTILGASTLGVGLLVGGAIFAFAGAKMKEKADEVFSAMLKNEQEICKNIGYFSRLSMTADILTSAIEKISRIYDTKVSQFILLVNREKDWNSYTSDEQLLVENTICVVSVLHKLINTPLLKVIKTDDKGNPLETDLDSMLVNQAVNTSFSALSERGIQ